MRIAKGRVFVGATFVDEDVFIVDDRFATAGIAGDESSREVVDASGLYVVPGFIDLHFHGCMASDCCDARPETFSAIARYEASRGVTAICPATMTYLESRLNNIVDAACAFVPAPDEAALVGLNMEGPFISPNRVGAQNPAYVQRCDVGMMRRLLERSGGLVKLVAVAPEERAALEFIREMSNRVRISLAHTCADYDCARAAFDLGARQLTHTYNAMPGLHHRSPGPIAAAAERDDVVAEVIADGVHVHPAMVRLAFNLFGASRVVLISDSMRACGMGDGVFDLGGQDVHVEGNVAKLADGTIAGSVADLASCLKTAVCDMGIPLEDALMAATETPARALGIFDERGSIAPGKIADAVLLDEQIDVVGVILRGKRIA